MIDHHLARLGRAVAVAVFGFAISAAQAETIRVDAAPAHVLNKIRPARMFGAGIDRLPTPAADKLMSPETLKQVLAAGWQPVSYRLNTELHVEAWHWNPQGTWSDPAGGYFTGSAEPGAELIRHSFAAPLPHRGVTHNEGTESDGFSRLTDGDEKSYWKSNPYLEKPFTGEDAAEPQWLVVDLGSAQAIDTVRIAWAAPYARRYELQSWTGDDPFKHAGNGSWKSISGGVVDKAEGGTITTRFASVTLRFLRVVLRDSSGTCDSHGSGDKRNCLGYAAYEIYAGRLTTDGLHDVLHHSPDQKQSATVGSSVDPWHAPADLNEAVGVQVGFDSFYKSGVTRGLPAMVPVAVLYGTPEDAAAEITYLEKRGYPISHVELGEESDGQYMTPEHYAALYLQWAAALRKVDPKLPLGGPAFASVIEDLQAWPDAQGDTSWFGRFLRYLKGHDRLSDLDFMSFEHYPYDVCKWRWDDLYEEPRLISHILDVWRKDGLPANVPMLVTEVNLAWQAGERFVDVFGALWLADYMGAFFSAGGAGSYFFHYLPGPLGPSCDGTQGTFGMHLVDRKLEIKQPLAQFFASQLIAKSWVVPGDGEHLLFPATSDVKDDAGHLLVTAYPVKRPDGQWALLVINKDAHQPHDVDIVFRDETGKDVGFVGTVDLETFGADQYTWSSKEGAAKPDGPAVTRKVAARKKITLPAASVTVVRGKIGAKATAAKATAPATPIKASAPAR